MDNVVTTGSNKDLIYGIITQLSTRFALKDLGPLWFFEGLRVNFFSGGLFLSQSKYTKDILQHVQMLEVESLSTLVIVQIETTSKDDDPTDALLYQSVVGFLQYLTFTHPDI